MTHPSPLQLSALLDGAISGSSLEHYTRHLAHCRECRDRLPQLSKQDDALRRMLACEPGESQLEACAREMEDAIADEVRNAPAPEPPPTPESTAASLQSLLREMTSGSHRRAEPPVAGTAPRAAEQGGPAAQAIAPRAIPAAEPAAVAASTPAAKAAAAGQRPRTRRRPALPAIDWSAHRSAVRALAARFLRPALVAGSAVAAITVTGIGLTHLPPVIRLSVPRLSLPRLNPPHVSLPHFRLPQLRLPRIEVVSAPAPEQERRPATPAVVSASHHPTPVVVVRPAEAQASPVPAPPAAAPTLPVRAAPAAAPPSPVRATPAFAPAARAPGESVPGEAASWPLLCGEVHDALGAPVVGARVSLADVDLSVRTDRRGRFCLTAPPGERTLSVTAQGFAPTRRLVSLMAQTLEVSLELHDRE